MTTTTTNRQVNNFNNTTGCGTCIPFEAIEEPGCYVCHWSGHLLRIPEDGVAPGRSPVIDMVAAGPLFVTKISHNSYITVTKARLLAANLDRAVRF